MDCGEKHYKKLMQNYPFVVEAFMGLEMGYQKARKQIALRGYKSENRVITERRAEQICDKQTHAASFAVLPHVCVYVAARPWVYASWQHG